MFCFYTFITQVYSNNIFLNEEKKGQIDVFFVGGVLDTAAASSSVMLPHRRKLGANGPIPIPIEGLPTTGKTTGITVPDPAKRRAWQLAAARTR